VKSRPAAASAAFVALALAGCTSASGTPAPTHTLTVYAAASLSDVFVTIGGDFEARHPGVRVRFMFAGSAELAAQVSEGAPADVFASADEAQLKRVGSLMVGDSEVFATNVLTIVVPAANPAHVTSLADLADPGIVSVICAPQVPCGAATQSLATAAGITLSPVSEETSVTDVLGKVASGQADAGVVYVTDVGRAHDIAGIPIAGAASAVNRYPIGVLAGSKQQEIARSFVDFLLGPSGRNTLARAGFGIP